MLPHLETARLRNRAFMAALYRLSWLSDRTGDVPVNWRAMETGELGSVYECLLELQPQLGEDGRTLVFASETAGQKRNQRKSTGSYYTPDRLVQALLDTALDPVLDNTEAAAADPAAALLKLSVIDPACGSGHFLLAAARRIATRLARIRAAGTPALADFRHALRDVARSCIHGVGRNPMAVELTKVALWIETVDPGLPLGFFDAQIRCGDALLGVFDLKVLQTGMPDAAYKPLTGDDKEVAKYYAQKNRRERAEKSEIAEGWGFSRARDLICDFEALRVMPANSVDQIDVKSARLRAMTSPGAAAWQLETACDLTHTRFAHSIGVFHTARTLIRIIERELPALNQKADPKREEVAVIAALLHDVGHGPFSHTFEGVQKSRGVSKRHERWTANYYGPFSRDLDNATADANAFGLLDEKFDSRQTDGATYSVFSLKGEAKPEAYGQLGREKAQKLALLLASTSVTVLELAVTVDWLWRVEKYADWRDEITRRKGVKVQGGRLEKAVALLTHLKLAPPDISLAA